MQQLNLLILAVADLIKQFMQECYKIVLYSQYSVYLIVGFIAVFLYT